MCENYYNPRGELFYIRAAVIGNSAFVYHGIPIHLITSKGMETEWEATVEKDSVTGNWLYNNLYFDNMIAQYFGRRKW